MDDEVLKCPDCGSQKIATSSVQMFMVNTGEHYCHSVKAHDSNSRAVCLDCEWEGIRADLNEAERGGKQTVSEANEPQAQLGAVPLDCRVRAQFEEWAKSQGLIAVSHGIRSESSHLGLVFSAWQAATEVEREACSAFCGRLAEMMEMGAGEMAKGGRLRQAEQAMLCGDHYTFDERSNV